METVSLQLLMTANVVFSQLSDSVTPASCLLALVPHFHACLESKNSCWLGTTAQMAGVLLCISEIDHPWQKSENTNISNWCAEDWHLQDWQQEVLQPGTDVCSQLAVYAFPTHVCMKDSCSSSQLGHCLPPVLHMQHLGQGPSLDLGESLALQM